MVPLCIRNFHIEVPNHHELGPMGVLLHVPDNILSVGGVFLGQLASHNEPALVSCCQLEADRVQTVFLVGIYRKVR